MEKYFLYIWLSAILIPVLGFILTKISYLRKIRIFISCSILLIAFFFNLFNLSFESEVADVAFLFITLLILTEFAWYGLKVKTKVLRYLILIAGLSVYLFAFSSWFISGPIQQYHKIFPVSVSHYSNLKSKYHIKELKYDDMKKSMRFFTLYKDGPSSFIEKKLDTYCVASGYENTPFSFKWNANRHDAVVSVIGDNDTLWVLKEVKF